MKEKIIRLREEGKSYNEICEELGCSKGTVSYHCGKDQKEKTKNRSQKRREIHVLENKTRNFQQKTVASSKRKLLQHKADDFQRERKNGKIGRHLEKTFNYKDVLKENKDTTECYLTGRKINLEEPRTYVFDHIIPASRGGDNSIKNLGIVCKEANAAKNDMMVDEFLELCKEILEHHGYKIRKA